MLSKIAITALATSAVHGRGISARVKGKVPRVESDKPVVKGDVTCGTAVDRLKKGSVDVDSIIMQAEYEASQGNTLKYFDKSFYGTEAVYNEQFYHENEFSGFKTKMEDGELFWERWPVYYPDNLLLSTYDPNDINDTAWHAANQGEAGDCYFIASLAGVAEHPELIGDIFSATPEKNAAGIHSVRFFIRGKPWIVDVDDTLPFDTSYGGMEHSSGLSAGLLFAKPFDTNGDLWAAVLEKAWGKVKGDITMAGQGGYVSTGLRSLVGSPSFTYGSFVEGDDAGSSLMDAWNMIEAADAAGYIMGTGTSGSGNDQENNACGIAMSHAYSLMAPFEMTDANGVAHKMYMYRNPWGSTGYSGQWAPSDPNWTDDLVAQVPFGVDPRQAATTADGIFVSPYTTLGQAADGTAGCFSDLTINHYRDVENYTDDWFDATDMDEELHTYSFTVPQDASSSDSLYVTLEGYYSEVIPMSCFYENTGDQRGHPLYLWRVDNVTPAGQKNYIYMQGEDQMHQPIEIPPYDAGNEQAGGWTAGDTFEVQVTYTWNGSPHKDYTLKVYSQWDTQVTEDGTPNQLHADGQEPSEVSGNSFELGDMVDSWYVPECGSCMGCGYCADDGAPCLEVADVPGDFAGHDTLIAPPTPDEVALREFQLMCEVDEEYVGISNHINSPYDAYYKRGDDWNGQPHYSANIDLFGSPEVMHLYMTSNGAYVQIAKETADFMNQLSQDPDTLAWSQAGDGFDGGYAQAQDPTSLLVSLGDQLQWGGFSTPFDLYFDWQTCERPEGFDPDADHCGDSNGGNGGNGGDADNEPEEVNTAIYNEDGSVKQAENITQLFAMIFQATSVHQVVDLIWANLGALFAWF